MNAWGVYDVLLAVLVSAQVAAVAYLYQPKWKALAFSFPIPFTFGTLALGQPLDATNVVGLMLVLAFMHAVRVLYQRLAVPIATAIATCALGYSLIGFGLAKILPSSNPTFYLACGCAIAVATVMVRLPRHADEPGHRTSLPILIKLPIILVVVFVLIVVKHHLRGFMASFPVVGVLAAYEARHSLQTMCRQLAIMFFCMIPLMIVSRLLEPRIGLGASLAVGWIPCLAILAVLWRSLWNNGSKGTALITQTTPAATSDRRL